MKLSLHTPALLPLLLLTACSDPTSAPPAEEVLLIRERAAAWFGEDRYEEARRELAPLVASDDALAEDLLRAAQVEFAANQATAAGVFLDRAAPEAADAPTLHFLRGQLHREAGEIEAAITSLERAHELAPGCLATRLALGAALDDLDRSEEAEACYQAVVDAGIENAGSWYVSAVYRLGRLLIEDGRVDEGQRYTAMRQTLEAEGIPVPVESILRLGNFGRMLPPPPTGVAAPAGSAELSWAARELPFAETAPIANIWARDLDGDARPDLLGQTAEALIAWRNDPSQGWQESVTFEGAADVVVTFDADNDEDLDLFVAEGEAGRFIIQSDEGWAEAAELRLALSGKVHAATAVDFDHDGDLDILCVGDFGARLYRNDGADEPESGGSFQDASEAASLPTAGSWRWCIIEDFDSDQDVDLLLGGPGELLLASSLRAGRFEDQTARLPEGTTLSAPPIVADFNADGRPDLWARDADLRYVQRPDNTFSTLEAVRPRPGSRAVDLDLDGTLDLVSPTELRLRAAVEGETSVALAAPFSPDARAVWADFDEDRDVDAVLLKGGALSLVENTGASGLAFRLSPRGLRDNRRAVGAIIEVRAHGVYRRIFWNGMPQLIGIGDGEKIDVLRLRWPNGVVQTHIDLDLSDQSIIDDPDAVFGEFTQKTGLIGSCPFLYTWNGETFEFISDVLGITPLGLPMAPGMLVPPDHDEFVYVSAEQLKEKDGELVLQFTEELREVTYLDRATLIAVDHPEDTEVHPNERFTFPPFPEHHTHTVRDPLAPLRAVGSDGRDWAKELSEIDLVHATPMQREKHQFRGMSKPWFLDLEFDPEAVADAKKLRLFLTGWLNWSNASANMAAAYHPRVQFLPPLVQVPDGQGGWRDTGPPVGFPAGKSKTMVLDLSEIMVREDPRIRLFCTLQLYWDRITLATDGDDAPMIQTELEPASAHLWERGFSAPLNEEGGSTPEEFTWDCLALFGRWDQHPGMYTRFGDCLELLGEIDDRMVIMGSGDCLTLRFDAAELPELPEGWRRDWLVFLDGWAKDRDPNSINALEVEPLPFHGMSGYPYPETESFPDGELHQRWRREWNTRPARRWLPDLTSQPGS
ncbi:MAG: FG-GAP-like repeat-containing protein [Planctomycetes bacterium]|nr:FG-GAP-like repeat-containing protein [Planctomycetota bacterium]